MTSLCLSRLDVASPGDEVGTSDRGEAGYWALNLSSVMNVSAPYTSRFIPSAEVQRQWQIDMVIMTYGVRHSDIQKQKGVGSVGRWQGFHNSSHYTNPLAFFDLGKGNDVENPTSGSRLRSPGSIVRITWVSKRY